MFIISPGHKYVLDSMEGNCPQTIQFIEKKLSPTASDLTQLTTVNDGTTNEEVLKVLIDRMYYLQKLHSCRENSIVITKLEECLMWLNKRTEDRKLRGVEGKNVN